MARPFEVEVIESEAQLEKAVKHAATGSQKERLQMLYWLKQGQVNSRQGLAQRLGRDQATITRWLRKYKDGGLSSLLEVKQAPGQVAVVRGAALERLKQRLQEPVGFSSYGQVQQWLVTELGLQVKYKTVYQLVRYRLKAKLKAESCQGGLPPSKLYKTVPRPRSLKQHPESKSQFKKT
ncbi:MAG: hypothetical protein NVS2B14_17320 [Chamaesiphon sp.]